MPLERRKKKKQIPKGRVRHLSVPYYRQQNLLLK